jgi:hypothetical protein
VPREEVPAQGRRLNHPTEMEGLVSPSQEEVIPRPEGAEYEYASDDPEESIYGSQPSFEASKPVYQSSFVIGDMATPYGGEERGVRRFSGASGTIEVDDFRREFIMWCELQKSRNTNLNPYMVWRSLFGCLEGAPLADYGEFEIEHLEEITTWRQFYAPDYVDVFGRGVSGPSVTKKGNEKEKEKGDEATSGESAGPPPEFNPTAEFFRRLYRDYQGQRADKMKALRTFARGGDESLREAYAQLKRLIAATQGVTDQQAIQHWYSILDKELKTLVCNEALRLGRVPTLRFVFEISERIEINLMEEKAAMGFLKQEEKPPEKVKAARVSLPSHAADTTATCFKFGKSGHLKKDCKEGKTSAPQSGGYCSGCGAKGHSEAKCWKLHPELKPAGSKGAKSGDNEKEKETKASTTEKKGWKAKFAELEAKMAAMSAITTTSGGAKLPIIPSFYTGGGFGSSEAEYGDFIMSGMALVAKITSLEALATTRRQAATSQDVSRRSSSSLDPQLGEGNRQVRLPESFELEEMVPTTSMVYPLRVEASTSRSAQGGARPVETTRVLQEAASIICQASLFSATIMSHPDFSPAAVFKRAATMCELGQSTVAPALKTELYAEEMVGDQEDTMQGLYSAATHVKTMPARPAIDRSSITPGVVVVDNSQGIFQLVGPKGKVFVPRRVLLDSGAQPLMLGASAINGLGLTEDTLEKCPWTINTSMGGTEHATAITKGKLSLKLNQDDVEDASFMKVRAIVTEAKSYDVLVGSTVLYPMGFTLDFWEETSSYRPGW